MRTEAPTMHEEHGTELASGTKVGKKPEHRQDRRGTYCTRTVNGSYYPTLGT